MSHLHTDTQKVDSKAVFCLCRKWNCNFVILFAGRWIGLQLGGFPKHQSIQVQKVFFYSNCCHSVIWIANYALYVRWVLKNLGFVIASHIIHIYISNILFPQGKPSTNHQRSRGHLVSCAGKSVQEALIFNKQQIHAKIVSHHIHSFLTHQ